MNSLIEAVLVLCLASSAFCHSGASNSLYNTAQSSVPVKHQVLRPLPRSAFSQYVSNDCDGANAAQSSYQTKSDCYQNIASQYQSGYNQQNQSGYQQDLCNGNNCSQLQLPTVLPRGQSVGSNTYKVETVVSGYNDGCGGSFPCNPHLINQYVASGSSFGNRNKNDCVSNSCSDQFQQVQIGQAGAGYGGHDDHDGVTNIYNYNFYGFSGHQHQQSTSGSDCASGSLCSQNVTSEGCEPGMASNGARGRQIKNFERAEKVVSGSSGKQMGSSGADSRRNEGGEKGMSGSSEEAIGSNSTYGRKGDKEVKKVGGESSRRQMGSNGAYSKQIQDYSDGGDDVSSEKSSGCGDGEGKAQTTIATSNNGHVKKVGCSSGQSGCENSQQSQNTMVSGNGYGSGGSGYAYGNGGSGYGNSGNGYVYGNSNGGNGHGYGNSYGYGKKVYCFYGQPGCEGNGQGSIVSTGSHGNGYNGNMNYYYSHSSGSSGSNGYYGQFYYNSVSGHQYGQGPHFFGNGNAQLQNNYQGHLNIPLVHKQNDGTYSQGAEGVSTKGDAKSDCNDSNTSSAQTVVSNNETYNQAKDKDSVQSNGDYSGTSSEQAKTQDNKTYQNEAEDSAKSKDNYSGTSSEQAETQDETYQSKAEGSAKSKDNYSGTSSEQAETQDNKTYHQNEAEGSAKSKDNYSGTPSEQAETQDETYQSKAEGSAQSNNYSGTPSEPATTQGSGAYNQEAGAVSAEDEDSTQSDDNSNSYDGASESSQYDH